MQPVTTQRRWPFVILACAGGALVLVGVSFLAPRASSTLLSELTRVVATHLLSLLLVLVGVVLVVAGVVVARQPRRHGGQGSPAWRPSLRGLVSAATPVLSVLVAFGALVYSGQTVQATWAQVRQGFDSQIADRYSRAIEQLGSANTDVRIGAIYALERIMRDSREDQSTIVEVIAAFVRVQAPATSSLTSQLLAACRPIAASAVAAPADIQTALTVLGRRNSRNDLRNGVQTIVDLSRTHLNGIDLHDAHLAHADLTGAEMTGTNMTGADLTGATMSPIELTGARMSGTRLAGANIAHANLSHATISGADLSGADLSSAALCGANAFKVKLAGANIHSADLTNIDLTGADLTRATLFQSHLRAATLDGANLTRAVLNGTDLNHAMLRSADMTNADLTGADLRGANLTGAKGARASQLASSCAIDETTIIPENLERPAGIPTTCSPGY